MALKALDIFKLTPKKNCKECGFPTCMAFSMKVAGGAVEVSKCPHMSDEAIQKLSEATAPPMKTLKVGAGENEYTLGGETVLFRHEKTLVSKNRYAVAFCDCMTEEEVDKLLKFEDLSTPKKIRDKAIFEVLYGTGIKVSELIDMNLEDIDLDIDYIYCGSSKNQRVIPLCEATKFYLLKYINESRDLLTYPEEKALFVNAQGQRFTRQGLWKLIKKYAKEADINKNINPTTLRHSFAIHLLNGGANVAVVSKILGNSNLSSLQLYLKYIDKNLRKEIKEKHPRENDINFK